MPLLDVIGVSSFNTSFYSCFAFLSKEEEGDYIWALNMFKNVLGTNEPAVIVSDRELALMNAIRVVFPRSTNLLCTWHVEKNISTNCKKHFEEGSDWDTFLLCWTGVIQSESESLFNEAWKELESAYKDKVTVIDYVRKTWLPFRQHFVKAWTDVHLHFGNRASSRAEGAHAKLKSYLQLSTNNLLVASERICLAVDNNFRAIKAQLAREKIRIPHSICCPFFKEIAYRVSVFALNKLFQQYKLASSPSPLQSCKGHFASTMGLPCAHMIRNMSNRVLHHSDIHSQWRIDVRSFEDGSAGLDNGKDKFKLLLQDLETRYQEWPITQKEAAENHVTQMVNSPMPILFDPAIQPHKGRPSGSQNKRASTSTKRDKSAFEIAENTRKCSKCNGAGHNIRTCSKRGTLESHVTVTNSAESRQPLELLDLNSIPNDLNLF